jgi:hypothetical protein
MVMPQSAPTALVDEIAPVYGGNNPTVAMLCRKVLKKDPTTRLKALQELGAVIHEMHPDVGTASYDVRPKELRVSALTLCMHPVNPC